MRRLSLIIGTIVLLTSMRLIFSSPHGSNFKMNCDDCHTTDGWEVNYDSLNFDHNNTAMPLTGQHKKTNCRSCHKSLVFSDAEIDCFKCHTDLHENTLGKECERCHTPISWIVTDAIGLHKQTRFPLIGPHSMAECSECHTSASTLRFEPLGIECIDCHRADYLATTSPNHQQAGYSTECTDCHHMNNYAWSGAGINHDFFPLKEGHAITDCYTCHTSGTFSQIPNTCISCHQPDYTATNNPKHQNLNFSTECKECHTIAPGWRPAKFQQHDGLFPIYSGEHNGEWDQCSDCHKNTSAYSDFTCIDCHEHNQSDMNEEHDDVQGYEYNSKACFSCHPTGSGEGGFNHSATAFPLTGAHRSAKCADCHTSGYQGTSTFCYDCHTPDYVQAFNPIHNGNNIPNTCADCHTTQNWQPATFPIHNQYYALSGAHAALANNCASCHSGNYTSTPNTCAGCHLPDYNQTTSPSHSEAQFPTECLQCHTESSWAPSTFNHQNTAFPLTGAHIAVSCSSCHQSGYSGTSAICYDCHQTDFMQATNPNHNTLSIQNTCSDCHTTQPGWSPATFPTHNQYYQLVGAHAAIANNCASCHNGNYNNTPNTCAGCHIQDYNSAGNPNHLVAQFPTDCLQCHNQSVWRPSTFNHDAQHFPIYSGKHQGEWDKCSDCHTNPSNYSVFTCLTCHRQGEMAEEHEDVPGYVYNSNACLNCHPDGLEGKSMQPIRKVKIN